MSSSPTEPGSGTKTTPPAPKSHSFPINLSSSAGATAAALPLDLQATATFEATEITPRSAPLSTEATVMVDREQYLPEEAPTQPVIPKDAPAPVAVKKPAMLWAGLGGEVQPLRMLAVALAAIWADDDVHRRVAGAARERAAGPVRTWADVAAETRAIYANVGIRAPNPAR